MISHSTILSDKFQRDYSGDGLMNNSWHTLYMNAPVNNIYTCIMLSYR